MLLVACFLGFSAVYTLGWGLSLAEKKVFLPEILRNAPTGPLQISAIWTADSAGNPTNIFRSGQSIAYLAAGENLNPQPLSVGQTWGLEGPCGSNILYTDIYTIPSGPWTVIYSHTAPACAGVYTYTFQAEALSHTISSTAVFSVTNPVSVTVRAQPAFDKCDNPSLGQLVAWRQSSPYRILNIYIGGVARHCPNLDLTPAWVFGALEQGWALIPTWVGPQAPCSDFQHRFSLDPAVAYMQGRNEAETAALTAANLGLTSFGLGGTIIYYDIEAYAAGSDPTCREAVKSFINGWVERLHELGNRAGAYGGACSSYVSEWATIPNAPDDVWIAAWYTDAFDPEATVWRLPCVADTLWANHQRLRQYTGSHHETWGGVRMEIDSDVTDGEVLASSTFSPTEETLGPDISSPVSKISNFSLLAAEQGWTLVNGRLYWTANNGLSWTERGPAGVLAQAAFFLNDQQGWLLSAAQPFLIYRTLDAGQSWQGFALPDTADLVGARSTSLFFLDAQNGWISLRLPSSANFSLGRLYRTSDGGQTWERLSVPSGEAVYFISKQVGWTISSSPHDSLYHTQDGGNTWTNQTLAPQARYYLPVFSDEKHGVLPVMITTFLRERLDFYISEDGGNSWTLSGSLAMQAADSEFPLAMTVFDVKHWLVVNPVSGSLLATQDGGNIWQELTTLPTDVLKIDFITPKNGWALASSGDCSFPLKCTLTTGLWVTLDGGISWNFINIHSIGNGF